MGARNRKPTDSEWGTPLTELELELKDRVTRDVELAPTPQLHFRIFKWNP